MKNNYSLYLVTTRNFLKSKSLLNVVEEAILGGATIIQLREKDVSYSEFKKVALEVLDITKKHGVPLIINDNVDLAIEINADGAHIGQSDLNPSTAREKLKGKILGISASSFEQAMEAAKYNPDYLGVGAVFKTTTKCDAEYIDHESIRKILATTSIPVVAIGGINLKNISQLKSIGIKNFAICSEILKEENYVKERVKLFKEVI